MFSRGGLGRVGRLCSSINGASIIYNKVMDTVLLLVKGYCITIYLMYSYTMYATPVADKVGRFQF